MDYNLILKYRCIQSEQTQDLFINIHKKNMKFWMLHQPKDFL